MGGNTIEKEKIKFSKYNYFGNGKLYAKKEGYYSIYNIKKM